MSQDENTNDIRVRTKRPMTPWIEMGEPFGLGRKPGFSFSCVAGDARRLVSREMEEAVE